jgi:hypothetical protein
MNELINGMSILSISRADGWPCQPGRQTSAASEFVRWDLLPKGIRDGESREWSSP